MRVLLIEDDEMLGDGLREGLCAQDFLVDWFRDGDSADTALRNADYDCMVLDLGLPGLDGLTWLRRWRGRQQVIPILILTARDAEDDRIDGLDTGADDYLVKPVSARELAARVRAVTRRARGRAEPVWRHGALAFDPASRRVTWRGDPVELTSREAGLLEVLLGHPGRVLSRQQLVEKMYGWEGDPESNALEVFVHHLRRKISPEIVRTVRGVGYALGPASD
ncbi:MAG: response regulator transcription factor [Burkholderiaceae bacterium]